MFHPGEIVRSALAAVGRRRESGVKPDILRAATCRAILALGASLSAVRVAHAYALTGSTWPSGSITMQLQLGTPSATLSDGSTARDDVALGALNDWNAQIARSQFAGVRGSTAAKTEGNRINNVFFSGDVYGQAWGSGVLAVTLTLSSSRNVSTECDVLFNATRTWDSYRGALRRTGVVDFRRVALHEFGHVLGLDHPDKATPAQNVAAVMNSTVSDVETLQTDDINGVTSLYSTTSAAATSGAPVIVAQPLSNAVQVTGSYTMGVTVSGSGPFTYSWRFRAAGSNVTQSFPLASGSSYTIGSVQSADAGTYSVVVTSAGGTVSSNSATLAVSPITTSADTTLADISTRGVAGNGSEMLIAGFVVGGTTAKNVLIRAVGPSLATFGVSNPLSDPQLTIIDSAGHAVASNGNWQDGGNGATLSGTFSRVGAFQFQNASRDAAIVATLAPGSYTAQVSANGLPGVALVEAYDADPDPTTARSRRLVNIATRGLVGTGADALIAGLVVTGPGPHTYLVRAVGATLATLGVAGALNDTYLQIYQGETLLRENDDWDTPASAQPALRDAATKVGAFALQARTDSAMLITLQPGSYTAKVTGFNGATGIALVEIYEVN